MTPRGDPLASSPGGCLSVCPVRLSVPLSSACLQAARVPFNRIAFFVADASCLKQNSIKSYWGGSCKQSWQDGSLTQEVGGPSAALLALLAVAFAMLGHSPESIVEALFGGGWGLCGWVRSLHDFRGIPQGIPPGDTAEDIWYTLLYPPVSKIL